MGMGPLDSPRDIAIAGCAVLVFAWSMRASAAEEPDHAEDHESGAPTEEVVLVRRPQANPLPVPSGLELGFRFGLAHPGGAVGGGAVATTPQVGDVAETWLPFGVEGGYRISPGAYVGALLQWGPAIGDDNALCAACGFRYDLEALGEVRLYPFPNSTVTPWVSFGMGWEIMHLSFNDPSNPTATYAGPILGNFQIGVDVRSKSFAAGPYFGAEIGEFTARSLDPEPPGEPSTFPHAAHEWFTIGLRGSYGPWAVHPRSGGR
jgi:hypothetical protein